MSMSPTALLLTIALAVTPTAAQAAGTYGRAWYWPQRDAFVVINATTQSGYFFRIG